MRNRTVLSLIWVCIYILMPGFIIAKTPMLTKLDNIINEIKTKQRYRLFYETDHINISNAIESLSRDISRLQKQKHIPILDKIRLRKTMSEMHTLIQKKEKINANKIKCENRIDYLVKQAYSIISRFPPNEQKKHIDYVNLISGKQLQELQRSIQIDERDYRTIRDDKKKKELKERIMSKRQQFEEYHKRLLKEVNIQKK